MENQQGLLTTESLENKMKKEEEKIPDFSKGLRFNDGKLRYDLIPTKALEEFVKVLTYGANKYTVRDIEGKILSRGDDNWKKGLNWKGVIASMKRHIAAWERGEDYDFDKNCEGCKSGNCKMHSGLLHTAHMTCNAMFLTEYYTIYPKGDDRKQSYLYYPKIGLDIDDVIADWTPAWIQHFNMEKPSCWFFDRDIVSRFEKMREEGTLDDFYLSIPPKIKGHELPFEPHCYITSRPVSVEITEKWLTMHGFPARPVYTLNVGESKLDAAKKSGIDYFVDDRFDNFVELNKNGICCYLFDSCQNQRYDVGHRRIKSLNELSCLHSI